MNNETNQGYSPELARKDAKKMLAKNEGIVSGLTTDDYAMIPDDEYKSDLELTDGLSEDEEMIVNDDGTTYSPAGLKILERLEKERDEKNKGRKISEKKLIVEDEGKTYLMGEKSKNKELLCDFTASFISEIKDDNGHVSRELEVTKKGISERLELSSDDLSDERKFRQAINKLVIVSYNAISVKVHNEYREFLEEKASMVQKKKTQFLGKLGSVYLAGKMVIDVDGARENDAFICPRENFIINIEDERKRQETLITAFESLHTLFGKSFWKYAGFLVGTFFCNEIADRFDFFPLLFLLGQRGTGKSVLAETLACFYGAQNVSKPFPISSTTKSIQRTCARLKGLPVFINEYRPSQVNNTFLCSGYDREGYTRAKTDNTLDTQKGEINSSLVILSTHNITGYKAEDVASRVIKIESSNLKKDTSAMEYLKENKSKLSAMVYELLKLDTKKVIEKIKDEQIFLREHLRGKEYEERCFETHSVIFACARLALELVPISSIKLDIDDCSDSITRQTKETKQIDVGYTFLNTLIAIVRNKKIEHDIAHIRKSQETPIEKLPEHVDVNTRYTKDDATETLIFSLCDSVPYVAAFSKQADLATADAKTLSERLKSLGAKNEKARDLGTRKMTWFYDIPQEE